MLAYTQADFDRGVEWGNPRTEIVVAHARAGHSEYDSDRGACLDDPNINIPLRTGFEGSLPCKCIPRQQNAHAEGGQPEMAMAANCDGTERHPT